MSKTKSTLVFSKLSLNYIDPPSLSATTPSLSNLPLEIFDDSLHLSLPSPQFKCRNRRIGYSGIPIYFIAVLANPRFREFTDVTLNVSAKIGSREIYNSGKTSPVNVDPQESITLPFHFISPVNGFVDVLVTAFFKFEGQQNKNELKERIEIKQSIDLNMNRVKVSPNNFLQLQVKNVSPYDLLNLSVRKFQNSSTKICRILSTQESYSSYIELEDSVGKIEISWSLPFMKKCRQTYSVPDIEKEAKQKISMKIDDIPQFVTVGKPFKISTLMKNNTEERFWYDLSISQNKYLDLIGKVNTRLEFEPNEEKRIEFNFIAFSQGNSLIPPFEFKSNNVTLFQIVPHDGVIIVGYEQN